MPPGTPDSPHALRRIHDGLATRSSSNLSPNDILNSRSWKPSRDEGPLQDGSQICLLGRRQKDSCPSSPKSRLLSHLHLALGILRRHDVERIKNPPHTVRSPMSTNDGRPPFFSSSCDVSCPRMTGGDYDADGNIGWWVSEERRRKLLIEKAAKEIRDEKKKFEDSTSNSK